MAPIGNKLQNHNVDNRIQYRVACAKLILFIDEGCIFDFVMFYSGVQMNSVKQTLPLLCYKAIISQTKSNSNHSNIVKYSCSRVKFTS